MIHCESPDERVDIYIHFRYPRSLAALEDCKVVTISIYLFQHVVCVYIYMCVFIYTYSIPFPSIQSWFSIYVNFISELYNLEWAKISSLVLYRDYSWPSINFHTCFFPSLKIHGLPKQSLRYACNSKDCGNIVSRLRVLSSVCVCVNIEHVFRQQ